MKKSKNSPSMINCSKDFSLTLSLTSKPYGMLKSFRITPLYLLTIFFLLPPFTIQAQVIKKNIIDLRTKPIFGTPHEWQFKPGDSPAQKNTGGDLSFQRAGEFLPKEEARGWYNHFPVQLAYTRYKDENGNEPFKNFNEYFSRYKGYGWYRTVFSVSPKDFKNKFKSDHLILELGKIGQADAVYLNGVFIGSTGLSENTQPNETLPDSRLFYDKVRTYKIPRDLLHLNAPNVLAVRTFAKYYISPGLSHGKFYIASDRKIERANFWDDFKKIFTITLMVLLGIFYLYWQFLFKNTEHATFYFALGSFAMAANSLMQSQIVYSLLNNALLIKKLEYIAFIAVVHLILDYIIKFSRVENILIKNITRIWHYIAIAAVIAMVFIPNMLLARRFMFVWGALPVLVLGNIIYIILKGRKTPAMGTVAIGLFGMVILLGNDVLVGLQFSWVTWETSLQDYAYAFFGMSVAGSIVSNMIKSKELIEKQQKEKERLARYFSPDVMETIITDQIEMGGQEKPIATLFADIAGFTSYSEKKQPAEVLQKLNLIFEKLSGIIFDHGATLDKYIGDCIMAFWGAPRSTSHDAYSAVACAVNMQKELSHLREKMGHDEIPFNLRIGVNFGTSIVGNIGSPKRMDYTVIGDAVNTASRIESNGVVGKVAISEATFNAAGGDQYLKYSETREITVKGKTQPVKIYIIEDVLPLKK